MPQLHRIRLAGPWEAEISDSVSHRELIDCQLKATLGVGTDEQHRSFWGDLAARRRFHRPTGLDEDSVIRLVIQGLLMPAGVFLNEHPLDRTDGNAVRDDQLTFVLTERLQSFNQIEVRWACDIDSHPTQESAVQVSDGGEAIKINSAVWLEIQ